MKILFVIRSLGRGGAERQLVTIANGLAQRNHEVHVAVFYDVLGMGTELHPSVSLHDLRKRTRWDLPRLILRFRNLVTELRPDVIHGYMPASNLLVLLGRFWSKGKIVWGIRTSKIPFSLYEHGRVSAGIQRLSAFLGRFADLIICNSEAGRCWSLDEGLPRDRLIVIPNGVTSPAPSSQSIHDSTTPCPRASSQRTIGLICRLDPVKGIEIFLEAFSRLSSPSGTRALIVGDGAPQYRSTLKQMACDLGIIDRVEFRGGTEIVSAVSQFDIGVSSSLSEGFSNAIAEMMSYGVPCVVTDVGDSAFIVGDTGLVVTPRSAVALAAAIDRLLAEETTIFQERRRKARQRVEEHFSVEQLVTRTEGSLTSLCLESSSHSKRLSTRE